MLGTVAVMDSNHTVDSNHAADSNQPTIDVSIIIPAKNAQSFIEESIESVLFDDGYTYEVIVVDHASTDNTAGYVKEIQKDHLQGSKVRLVTAPDGGGPSRAKNTGLKHATGKFVTFLDADDVRVQESILHQLKILRDNPTAGSVFGRIAGLCDGAGTPIRDQSFYNWIYATNALNRARGNITPDRIVANELPGYFTLLYRRSLIDTVGKFDETLPQAEDFDFAYRCCKQATMLFFDSPCVFYRVHDRNLSVMRDEAERAVARPETKIAHMRALAKHGL